MHMCCIGFVQLYMRAFRWIRCIQWLNG